MGVCWRLARQMVNERGDKVTVWVDDWAAARALLPGLPEAQGEAVLERVRVMPWAQASADADCTGDLTIEAFACTMPASVLAQLRAREAKPLWINLDYFSAEEWVPRFHLGSSLDQEARTRRVFFFPGVVRESGGILRERGLLADRDAWLAKHEHDPSSPVPRSRVSPSLTHVCFAYAHAPYAAWRAALAGDDVWACGGYSQTALGERARAMPWMSQPEFDRLLWRADILWVRGEDSFARALWAGRPFVWQIYPQEEAAHHPKLAAWLDHYTRGWPPGLALALRELHAAWNVLPGAPPIARAWSGILRWLPHWQLHSRETSDRMAGEDDLLTRLGRVRP